MRTILTLSIASLFAAAASAQPGYPPSNTPGIPGLYGGGLSPFLNLRNNNRNPAINYYNFTRPYTGGTYGNAFVNPYAGGGGMNQAASAPRFFPTQAPPWTDDEAVRQRIDDKDAPDENGFRAVQMPPAGHGGGFMNTMGYFGLSNATRPAATLGRPRTR